MHSYVTILSFCTVLLTNWNPGPFLSQYLKLVFSDKRAINVHRWCSISQTADVGAKKPIILIHSPQEKLRSVCSSVNCKIWCICVHVQYVYTGRDLQFKERMWKPPSFILASLYPHFYRSDLSLPLKASFFFILDP